MRAASSSSKWLIMRSGLKFRPVCLNSRRERRSPEPGILCRQDVVDAVADHHRIRRDGCRPSRWCPGYGRHAVFHSEGVAAGDGCKAPGQSETVEQAPRQRSVLLVHTASFIPAGFQAVKRCEQAWIGLRLSRHLRHSGPGRHRRRSRAVRVRSIAMRDQARSIITFAPWPTSQVMSSNVDMGVAAPNPAHD
jgi:hypothetical protein